MMEHNTVTDKAILDKLNAWESQDDPLAPLTSKQTESIMELMNLECRRPFPAHLKLPGDTDEMSVASEFPIASADSDDISGEFSTSAVEVNKEHLKVDNLIVFLSWFSEIEDKMLEDNEKLNRIQVEGLCRYFDHCCSLLDDVTSALNHLDTLRKQYVFVSDKTNSLHEACEHLLTEQTNLMNSLESMAEKLSYFNEIENLTQKVNSPTLSVMSESFVPLLTKLDECIEYLEANQSFKEADVYLARFRYLQLQALGMIRTYALNTLQQITEEVLPKPEELSLPDSAFTIIYGKFRARAPRIRSLVEQIEQRSEKNLDYQQLLADCHQCYFSQRELLLGPSVSMAINELAQNHPRDHCSFVRSGCAFLVHVCEDEYQLYYQFFTQKADQLMEFLERLCTRLYDVLRPIIIHINHLETLAELCSILKIEMLEQHVQNNPIKLQAFERVSRQMLEDVQERLVYRTHIYIKTDILNYNPAPGDLAYPEKLEMMESIAESLAQNTLSRSSSKSSLVSFSSTASGASFSQFGLEGSSKATAATSAENKSDIAILPVTSNEQLEEGKQDQAQKEDDAVSISDTSSVSVKPRMLTYSPADLHGMWYPTVRRALVCLSKLYRCLDKSIFQGLAQEVLSHCIQSLSMAGHTIAAKKTPLDGQLFQIKHLLILREQISPFQIDFAIKETTVDFSRVKYAAYGLLHKRSRFFSFSSNNALLEFLVESTPQVIEQHIDSKKVVDTQLKVICEEFITSTSELLLGPILTFLNKARVILQVKDEETTRQVSLCNQPFATPDKLSEMVNASYRHLKSKLPSILRSMGLYLANSDTEFILFRPVKSRIISAYEQLLQIIRTNYTDEDQAIIACPSTEQISILLSSLMGK